MRLSGVVRGGRWVRRGGQGSRRPSAKATRLCGRLNAVKRCGCSRRRVHANAPKTPRSRARAFASVGCEARAFVLSGKFTFVIPALYRVCVNRLFKRTKMLAARILLALSHFTRQAD